MRTLRKLIVLPWLLLHQAARAHHSNDHLILSENSGQVIAATREGSANPWAWLIWSGASILLLLVFVRWRNSRK